MKGLFITYPVNYQKDQSGIKIKIDGQIRVFNNNGIECEELLLEASKVIKNYNVIKKIQWIPFFNVWPRWVRYEAFKEIDFLYMRKPSTFSAYMLKALKWAKQVNPKLKIYLEIPTYPYDNEMRKGIKCLLLIKEKLYRNKLKDVVDYVTLPSFGKLYDTIFGIPVIDFYNGNDFSTVTLIENHIYREDSLNLICVANFQPTHGYERIIKGVIQYNKLNPNNNVILHMVGDGIECEKYKNIASDSNNIIFYGFKRGAELERIYEKADIAISALGLYKINNGHVSCLKNGEYLAKGLPVVYTGGNEDVPDNCKEFFYNVSNNDSPINIDELICFTQKLHSKYGENLNTVIRNEAIKYYDISVSMMSIVHAIKDGGNT